jgi:hypothetical protein
VPVPRFFNTAGPNQPERHYTLAIEIKVWRPGRPDPQAAGLAQLDGYLAGLGLDSGWLVIFDRRPGLPPVEERLTANEDTSPAGNRVTVIRA